MRFLVQRIKQEVINVGPLGKNGRTQSIVPKLFKYFSYQDLGLICGLKLFTCSPINRTHLPCFEMVSIRKSVLTLSTLGTRILVYSGTESLG